MPFTPVLSTVAETISVAVAPVFLLAGIAGTRNVFAGRLSRLLPVEVSVSVRALPVRDELLERSRP
ncbi:hypothetical protein [Stakelama saccharophila]|uniref:Uncharacterized protein n=1 Tax=Stakelama saccharophila TaxID=3075605 RepID=A0ABZ0BBI4_9SPHN|nr:hypothetical protein [Stakelama sp. W311]WNO54415.1 hypothetical protein RPR59_03940 [Stakelama sp. W311]